MSCADTIHDFCRWVATHLPGGSRPMPSVHYAGGFPPFGTSGTGHHPPPVGAVLPPLLLSPRPPSVHHVALALCPPKTEGSLQQTFVNLLRFRRQLILPRYCSMDASSVPGFVISSLDGFVIGSVGFLANISIWRNLSESRPIAIS